MPQANTPLKRLLILAYHFSPLNAIGARRGDAFAEHVSKHGFFAVVITHAWERQGEGEAWRIRKGGDVEVERKSTSEVHRLPLAERSFDYGSQPFKTARQLLAGRFDLGRWLPASREAYARYLTEAPFDAVDGVLAIFNPHHHLELGSAFAAKHGIPFYADLRDLWTADAEAGKAPPGLKGLLRDRLMRHYWKKWLQNAALISTVSPPWAAHMAAFSGRPTAVVRNGVEAGLFASVEKRNSKNFTIAHVGTLYDEQRLDGLFHAAAIASQQAGTISLRFIGVRDEAQRQRLLDEQAPFMDQALELKMLPRVTRPEALIEMKSADLLYYPAWDERPGILAGKLYEYMASGTPVLVTSKTPAAGAAAWVSTNRTGAAFQPEAHQQMAEWIALRAEEKADSRPSPYSAHEVSREGQVAAWALAVETGQKKEAPVPASDAS